MIDQTTTPETGTLHTANHFYEISSKADCLASLAIAASLVSEGSILSDEHQRKNVAADIVEALRWIAKNLSEQAYELAEVTRRRES